MIAALNLQMKGSTSLNQGWIQYLYRGVGDKHYFNFRAQVNLVELGPL